MTALFIISVLFIVVGLVVVNRSYHPDVTEIGFSIAGFGCVMFTVWAILALFNGVFG